MTALADSLHITPLGARLADVIARWTYAGGVDGPVMAAARVCGDPTIAAALDAAQALARVDRLHQPERWSGSDDSLICYSCRTAWPCPSRQAIDDRPEP